MAKNNDLQEVIRDFVNYGWPAAKIHQKGYSSYLSCRSSVIKAIRSLGFSNEVKVVSNKNEELYLVNTRKCEKEAAR